MYLVDPPDDHYGSVVKKQLSMPVDWNRTDQWNGNPDESTRCVNASKINGPLRNKHLLRHKIAPTGSGAFCPSQKNFDGREVAFQLERHLSINQICGRAKLTHKASAF